MSQGSGWLKVTHRSLYLQPTTFWCLGISSDTHGFGVGANCQKSFSFPKQLGGQEAAALKCVWVSFLPRGDSCTYPQKSSGKFFCFLRHSRQAERDVWLEKEWNSATERFSPSPVWAIPQPRPDIFSDTKHWCEINRRPDLKDTSIVSSRHMHFTWTLPSHTSQITALLLKASFGIISKEHPVSLAVALLLQ